MNFQILILTIRKCSFVLDWLKSHSSILQYNLHFMLILTSVFDSYTKRRCDSFYTLFVSGKMHSHILSKNNGLRLQPFDFSKLYQVELEQGT